jgi:hypothetical protein
MNTDPIRTEGEPHDRLTRLCDAMTDALEAHAEYADTVQCAIFLNDGKRGGLILHGYADDRDAIANLFGHLQAIFQANGMSMELITVPNDASGL